MYYDPFVLPFTLGLIILLVFLVIKYWRWIRTFSKEEKRTIRRNLISLKTLKAAKEVFMESLVHRRMFRINPFLGYMHLCFGLGWFLLIVVGKVESTVYHTSLFNPPYFAIFFRFFHPVKETFPYCNFFAFVMDLILLVILSGLFLALMKRLCSRIVGLRKTTNHRPFDLLILYVLWSIFPLRLLAESFTCGLRGGGSFLTHTTGDFFAGFLPLDSLTYPLWWAYSLSLGIFFLLLPFSRYMHIPTEIVYIFLKRWGIRQGKRFNAFSEMQLYACSRCGICIDRCQLNSSLGMNDTQPVYYLKKIRHGRPYGEQTENCLMCGRCEAACPVNLSLNAIRLSKRTDCIPVTRETYAYVPTPTQKSVKVAYFSGCMGHLTPSVIRAMGHIFDKAGIEYSHIDEEEGICCGRPMMLSGNHSVADIIVQKNKALIEASGTELLVTSCPICYKTFREEYGLSIPVMHHTEYIDLLIREGRLRVTASDRTTVFHNPCELGRGCGVTAAPERTLAQVSHRISTRYDGTNSLCCGGSLAHTRLSAPERNHIAADTVAAYSAYRPDIIATACPLCKKTLDRESPLIPVRDLAEVVAEQCV